jgi:type III polyketide synthase
MEFLMTQNLAGAMLNVNHAFTSMQPKLPRRTGSNGAGRLDLSIVGLGTQYPPYELEANVLDTLAKRHYPETPA